MEKDCYIYFFEEGKNILSGVLPEHKIYNVLGIIQNGRECINEEAYNEWKKNYIIPIYKEYIFTEEQKKYFRELNDFLMSELGLNPTNSKKEKKFEKEHVQKIVHLPAVKIKTKLTAEEFQDKFKKFLSIIDSEVVEKGEDYD